MSPRTKQQIETLKRQRREQIIQVALRLFATNGYANTSISDIALNAKLSKGLMYNYFTSKEDLLNEVVVYAFKDAVDIGDFLLNDFKNEDLHVLFSTMVHGFFSLLKEQKELWRLTIPLAMQVSNIPSVRDSILKIYKDLLFQLESLFLLMKYSDPKQEALLLGAIIDGISIQYILYEGDYPIENMEKMIINKYLEQNRNDT